MQNITECSKKKSLFLNVFKTKHFFYSYMLVKSIYFYQFALLKTTIYQFEKVRVWGHFSYISFYDSEIELVCISVKKISRHKHPRVLWMICKHIPQQNIWQEFSYEHKHFYVPQIIRHPVFYENYKKLESHAPDTWIKELTHKLRIFSKEILISIMHFIYDSVGFCCCFVTFCKLISINYIIS